MSDRAIVPGIVLLTGMGRGCWTQLLTNSLTPTGVWMAMPSSRLPLSPTIHFPIPLLFPRSTLAILDSSGTSELEGKRNVCLTFLNVKAKQSTKKGKQKKTYKNIMGSCPQASHIVSGIWNVTIMSRRYKHHRLFPPVFKQRRPPNYPFPL